MLKLYKRIDTQLHYWETWDTTNKSTIVHWGMVGEKGFQREEKLSLFSNFRKKIQKEIDKLLSEGYHQIDIDDHITLLIEYDLTRLDPIEALKKRHRLEDRMNQTLGWIGLGNCDGGSIGSGTMEVCCLVVDFPIAKDAIIKDLRETEFSDYSRIFEEKY